MPAMCRLIVMPMMRRAAPWSCMCTGVSAMTPTMIAWAVAMA